MLHNYESFNWKKIPYLKKIVEGIRKLEPIPKSTVPIRDHDITGMMKIAPKIQDTWFMHTIMVMTIFAWSFVLRCSEYTRTQYHDAPKVTDLSFEFTKRGDKVINYSLHVCYRQDCGLH